MKIIKLIGVNKNFGGLKAVDNCSFDISRGEITALTGPNGSGKSTVFNLISGILNVDSGKIIFNEIDITNFSIEKISNIGISRAFQYPRLFENLTVRENLLLSLNNDDTKFWKNLIGYKTTEEKIEEKLDIIEMQKSKEKISRHLSFGQKRLVELGRSVLSRHELLILDEPVAGIGHKLKEKIAKFILYLKEVGKTIIFIEHDTDFTLKIADNIISMDEGKIASFIKNKKI
jgi:ABC-type branched-subunit amino acid transport system ATPase component